MKNIILCAFLAFSYVSPTFAKSIKPFGYETHGGDAICAEFLAVFDDIITKINTPDLDPAYRLVVNALLEQRPLVQLSSQPELSLDGVPKDAINYSGEGIKKIEISQKSWARLTMEQKQMLVLHEMLPIASFNDKDYAISLSLYKKAYGRNQITDKLKKAIFYCKADEIQKITPDQLKSLSDIDVPGYSLIFLCIPASEALAKANWDFNLCDDQDKTALQNALDNLEFLKRVLKTNPIDRTLTNIEKNLQIIDLIRDHGGTLECSGHYKKEF